VTFALEASVPERARISPLAELHAAVAPLTGALRIELNPPDRDGWVDERALCDPDTGPLADLNARFVAAGFGANRRAVAASLLLRYGWAAGFIIAAWLARGDVVRIRRFALKFSAMTLVEALWVQDARIVAGLGEDDGHAALLASLIDFTEPLIASQHAWSRFSRHALWAMVTSSWAAQFAAIGRRIGCEEKAVAQARRLMEGDAEIAAAAPLLYAIRAGRQAQTCQRRAACCLYFKGPRQHFCASCPIIPPAERIARNRDWVATGH
jgi:hypothetical protein